MPASPAENFIKIFLSFKALCYQLVLQLKTPNYAHIHTHTHTHTHTQTHRVY